MDKQSLIGFDISELKEICISNNFPSYHGEQLFSWIYKKSITNTEHMTNVPNELKSIIKEKFKQNNLKIKNTFYSKIDDTIKFLVETSDNNLIESVSMIDKGRHTVCISSQIGCSVDCSFCETGKMGIIRNLSCGEIIEQLILVNSIRDEKITNVVFMGMGEPFLNYDNVIKSCYILHNQNGFGLSSKKITISTSGILPKIDKYINEKHKFKLAISLNASNNDSRNQLIPINKKWPIEKLLESLKQYKYSKYRPLMFEYILIEDINDSQKNAKELGLLLKNINCKINIIPYNQTSSNYQRSNNIDTFIEYLNQYKFKNRVFIRWSKGQDINAACGQLVTENG